MAALSKRAQLELQGWKFTPVPHFCREGALGYNPETGWKSPAHYDHKNPDAWIAVPPSGLSVAERRFENRSPNIAVRWAWSGMTRRSLTLVLEIPAKTREGVAMKARVIGAIFADKNGLRSAAVRSLTDDIAAVMGDQPC